MIWAFFPQQKKDGALLYIHHAHCLGVKLLHFLSEGGIGLLVPHIYPETLNLFPKLSPSFFGTTRLSISCMVFAEDALIAKLVDGSGGAEVGARGL